jgi:uncharacterized protein YigE (DUF2233 family)
MRFCLLFLISLLPCFAWSLAPAQWTNLADGMQYTDIMPDPTNTSEHLHAFRFDLHKYTLKAELAKNINQTSLFVDQVSSEKNVVIAINGGFFSPDLQSLGLRINNSQVLSPIKKISWWGIFLLQNNHAVIIPLKAYHPSSQTNFAIQAGPRLIIDGAVAKLHDGKAQRSALGITRDGKVIIAVTDNLLLSTEELAKMLSGLGCYQALNLDGGSSSQLYAHVNSFSLHVRSLRPVADVIVVTPH